MQKLIILPTTWVPADNNNNMGFLLKQLGFLTQRHTLMGVTTWGELELFVEVGKWNNQGRRFR